MIYQFFTWVYLSKHESVFRNQPQLLTGFCPLLCFPWDTSLASPTGLHVVRTGFGSYGRGQTLHLSSLTHKLPSVLSGPGPMVRSLYKRMLTLTPGPKLLYQSIPNSDRMITSVMSRELPNFVAIGSTAAAALVGEIYSSRFSFF